MSDEPIKKQLHAYIDQIEDEVALNLLREAAETYYKRDFHQLSIEQQQRINESITQAKNGKVISNEDVAIKVREWLTK